MRGSANNTSMKLNMGSENNQVEETGVLQNVSRRNFLQLAGGLAGAGLLISSCRRTAPDTVYVGKGDTALLNYLLILEEVLSAVYVQANLTAYYGLNKSQLDLLADMRDHQLAHKELLKKVLGSSAIPDIVTVLSAVTYADKTDFLKNSVMLEDLAVAAYNGAAKRFADTNYILLTAKMATLQARHAAYSRELLAHNTLADATVVNLNGLDQALAPITVFNTLKPYIQTKFDISNLPA